jgi:Cation efflux family
LAAVFGEVGEEVRHRRVIGAVDERAAFAAALHQARLLQVIEVEGERGRGQAQPLPDLPGSHSVKIAIAAQLGSRAMRADAVESITCGWMSLVVVIGLSVDLVLGAWWVDAVTSLAILWFVIKEGREAWRGEDCCDRG